MRYDTDHKSGDFVYVVVDNKVYAGVIDSKWSGHDYYVVYTDVGDRLVHYTNIYLWG